ncbi:MAG TPA: ATP-binding protein [Pyrinomonadaceae bacterium]|jgi:signal transduction histidine kinase/ActR/RegA family two-component response regulator|nr:ATP-binding protein [Pyrinomonadaceae bacterium]
MKSTSNFSPIQKEPRPSITDGAAWNHAPRADCAAMGDTDHFVQFYEADGFLLNSLSGFIGKAITAGDGAVVVATEAHRNGLDELLLANGVDVAGAKARGSYVALDAENTLAKFMVDGAPERERFNEVIGSVFAGVADGRLHTRAFGEMVGLLWSQGNHSAAIRLEEFWNDLQQVHSFSLFCAYPMNGFGGEKFIEPYSNVCGVHSRVIPSESYASIPDLDARLRAIALLQQKARSLETEVAERRLVEQRLRLALAGEQIARAEAETANRMKDEFLATVSHEIRTPLNAIIGWSHLLRTGRLDEATAARAMETIDRNAKAQAQLIEDILDVSRVITGKLRLRNEPVDIASVINAAIDSVQLAIDSKDLHLEVTLDPTARHTFGDPGRLQQVVWNLLSNAIKFTPAGGRIGIKVKRADNLQILVSDTGHGISPEFLPYIFDRFRQADGTTTRSHGGLGLGLAIVRHLVELHGGSVHVDSAGAGQGATFTITLPLAPQSTSRRKKVTGNLRNKEVSSGHFTSLPSLDAVKVLLVDDDPDTLQVVSVMLGNANAVVHTASSASEALEILEWFQPQVLVSDLAMPGEDGYSLIRKVRALGIASDIPAIALTSYVRVEDRARALTAGFNMFVPKPVQPEELIAAIANLAEGASEPV